MLQAPFTGVFWETVVSDFTEALWIQHFRVTNSTFDELCDAVRPLLEPAAHCPRRPVNVAALMQTGVTRDAEKLFPLRFCEIHQFQYKMHQVLLILEQKLQRKTQCFSDAVKAIKVTWGSTIPQQKH